MNANDLLIWLSAKGNGSWSRYRAAVDEMQSSDDLSGDDEDLNEGVTDSGSLPLHLRLKLNLERLGHAEFFRKDFPNGWRVVPPTLACTYEGVRSAGILCGSRTDQLLDQVRQASASYQIEITEQPECPDRIRIIANDSVDLEHLADEMQLCFQPDAPRMLLAAVPPVDDYQLRKPAELPFGSDWDVSQFSSRTLGWTEITADKARAASFGLFRFNVRFSPEYYLQLSGKRYRVPVQVGKFVVLKKKRRQVVSYDAAHQMLSMPVSCRPPHLVDRALTLCSGEIPAVEDGQLQYRNICRDIAITALALLKQ